MRHSVKSSAVMARRAIDLQACGRLTLTATTSSIKRQVTSDAAENHRR
jgi:hypothetical protein